MIPQRDLAAIWSNAQELWDREVAEAITHIYIAVNFGKKSLTELTHEEAHELIMWLLLLAEADS